MPRHKFARVIFPDISTDWTVPYKMASGEDSERKWEGFRDPEGKGRVCGDEVVEAVP